MGFRFSLSTVLRFRESVEKREELALQTLQLEIAGGWRAIEELAAKIEQKCESLELAMQRPLPASFLQLMLGELNEDVAQRQTLLLRIEILQQKRKVQLKSYRTAHSGRQMLTDIFTQQRNAYEQKQLRTQQRLIDDIFAVRSHRN
jgi:flagellar biosynthesis chaperone FliJ